jgi:uncharacterized membrane protein YdjX (TVP38/TMEM64 family)
MPHQDTTTSLKEPTAFCNKCNTHSGITLVSLSNLVTLSMSRNSSSKPIHPLWFWLALGAATVLFSLLLYSQTFRDTVESAVLWAKEMMSTNAVLGAVVFFLFAALSAMLAFTSSAALVPSANLVWGKLVTFLLLWGGWVTGAMISFGIGNVARPLLNRIGYKDSLKKYQQLLSKHMRFWLVLVFCLAVPSEIPGLLFGGIHYSFLKFLAAVAIAESIYALGLVIAGESLVAARPFPLLATVGVLIMIVAGAGWLLRKAKKRKSDGK